MFNSQEQEKKLSLTITLLIVCILVALGGLIYIYGEFTHRNLLQISSMVKVSREFTPNHFFDQNLTEKDIINHQSINLDTINKSNNSSVNTASRSQQKIKFTEMNENSPFPANEKKPENTEKEKSYLAQIFFVNVTDSGHMSLKKLYKHIRNNLEPVNAALESLLQGPSDSDRSHGIHSLIPEGSQLISVSIKNKIAYLNFNEEFMFNHFGTDGYQAQLQQVVYTVTEIPSIEAVQITIEGKKIDFLYEGVFVGTPLSRNSFH